MKTSKFTEAQIAFALKQAEDGTPFASSLEACFFVASISTNYEDGMPQRARASSLPVGDAPGKGCRLWYGRSRTP